MTNFTAAPQLVVDFSYFDSDNRKQTLTIREGDILKDVVYVANGISFTKTGKVTAIMTTTSKSTTNYSDCACLLRSTFASHVVVDGFVLDSSDVYGSDINMIYTNKLQAIGEVVQGKKEVDLENLPEGGLSKIVSELLPGQELKVGPGVINEALEIPAGCVLRGANAGIGASKGYRAQSGELAGETVINAPLTVKGSNVIIDGVTLSGEAVLTTSGSDVEMILSNTRIDGLAPIVEEGKKAYAVKGASFDDEVLLTVTNCYFGVNPTIYNFFELNCKLQSGSVIRNCYFAKEAGTHNMINLYEVADGAYINIINNVFEYSANAVRVGVKGAPSCTINMTNNTYNETSTDDYAGLFFIQPYGKATTSMANVIINVDSTTNNSGVEQLFYCYMGENDTKLTPAQMPKVYVDTNRVLVEEHIVA